jgi:hypothetical protein
MGGLGLPVEDCPQLVDQSKAYPDRHREIDGVAPRQDPAGEHQHTAARPEIASGSVAFPAWCSNDLVGHVLTQEDWEVVRLPAIAGWGTVKRAWFRPYTASELRRDFNRVVQSWDTADKATELTPP